MAAGQDQGSGSNPLETSILRNSCREGLASCDRPFHDVQLSPPAALAPDEHRPGLPSCVCCRLDLGPICHACLAITRLADGAPTIGKSSLRKPSAALPPFRSTHGPTWFPVPLR